MPVPFRIQVPSSRPGVKPYTVERQADGRILHDCPAWRFRHTCRHVDRAIALADRPAETFVADACDLLAGQRIPWFELLAYTARGDASCHDALHELLAGIFGGLHAAQARAEYVEGFERGAQERAEEEARIASLDPTERAALAAEAFAEFGS